MRTYNPSTQADTLKLTYGFDADPGAGVINSGNVMSWVATGAQVFSRTYTYDELNRLKTMAAPGDTCSGLSWTYDIWANRTHQTPTGGTCNQSQLTINTLNRIADTGFGYDAAGNLTAEPGKTYQYDAEGRMTSINGGAVASYVYNASGQRVRKIASGTTTEYLYDLAGNVIAEFQGTTWTKGYVYFGGLLAQYSDGTTYFAHKDHLGSTRLLTKPDKSFNPTDAYDYLPFGESTSTGSTSHKFTGHEHDAESTFHYFGARYYSPGAGRFLSVDPSFESAYLENPQTWNRYAYVYNRPLQFNDPDGRVPNLLAAVGVGAAGGILAASVTALTEYYDTGEISGQNVAAAFAGGFVSGFAATATLGLSLVPQSQVLALVAVGGLSNVAGGFLTRALDSPEIGTDVFDLGAIRTDATLGVFGAGAGWYLGRIFQVASWPVRPRPRDFGGLSRAYREAIRAYYQAFARAEGRATAIAVGIGVVFSNSLGPIVGRSGGGGGVGSGWSGSPATPASSSSPKAPTVPTVFQFTLTYEAPPKKHKAPAEKNNKPD
jgi:RHS repeat-associated protein